MKQGHVRCNRCQSLALEAGKRANHAKSRKTCKPCQKQENVQTMPKAGKRTTGTKRGKTYNRQPGPSVKKQVLVFLVMFVVKSYIITGILYKAIFFKSGFIFYVVDYLAQVFDVLKIDLKDDVVSCFFSLLIVPSLFYSFYSLQKFSKNISC